MKRNIMRLAIGIGLMIVAFALALILKVALAWDALFRAGYCLSGYRCHFPGL